MDSQEDRNQQDAERHSEEPAIPDSLDSLRAAKPTARRSTTSSRLAMLNRNRLIARSSEKSGVVSDSLPEGLRSVNPLIP